MAYVNDNTVAHLNVLLVHGSRSQSGGTDSDTTWHKGGCVTGNGVLVQGDVGGITDLLDLGSGQTDRSEIPEDQVVLSSIGLELVAVLEEDLGHGICVGSDLLGVGLKRWVGGLLEGDGDTGDGLVSESAVVKSTLVSNARCCGVHPGKLGRRRR